MPKILTLLTEPSLKKYDVIQLVAVIKSLLKSQIIKNIVPKILTLLIEPFTMSPNAPNKTSLDFLSDYYFNTKSPVEFTSPLALYREAKKRYPSLTFCQIKTSFQVHDGLSVDLSSLFLWSCWVLFCLSQ